MSGKNIVAKSFKFVLRYKWIFVAALAVLAILLMSVFKREGLAARCSPGKVWDAGRNKCVCGGKSEWDGKKCVTCSAGMFWDWKKKPKAGCQCLPGTKWNGKWCAKSAPTPLQTAKDCPNLWGGSGSENRVVPGGFKATNVYSSYHYYAPGYETSTLQCSDVFGDTLANNRAVGKKLMKYPWTAFCVKGLNTRDDGFCGKCFRVKNRATGTSTVVRAVDHGGGDCMTGSGGLDLDPCAFNAIDQGGQGVRDGHLYADIEEVECGTDAEIYDARR
jgi:hypothetical protein